MKTILFLLFSLFLVISCKTKEVASTGLTQKDYQYIRTFHKGVRAKNEGQNAIAIQLFDSCFIAKPTDDAAAYALSQLYLQQNQLEKSAEYIQKAAKLDPKNEWYTQELAYMFYNQKRFKEAGVEFEKLVKNQPRNIDYWYGYSEVLKQEKQYEKAISALGKMEDQLGTIPEITLEKYELYKAMGQEAKGIEEIKKARIKQPDDLNLIGTLVDYYFKTNQADKAQEMLQALVKSDPTNGRANLALGEMYLRQYKKTEAYDCFSKGFDGKGVDIDTKMNVLLLLIEKSVPLDDEAIVLAKKMVEQHPTDPKSHAILGDFYMQKDQKTEALNAFRKALNLNETKLPIWNQVMMLEYELKNFDSLYVHSRECAAIYPNSPEIQLMYTISCVQTTRFTEAIDAAEVGRGVVVKNPVLEAEFWAQQGEAEFMSGKKTEGNVSYGKAIELDSKNVLTKNNYCVRLAHAGLELEKAKRMITEIIVEYPRNAAYLTTQGLVLLKLNLLSEAGVALASAIALNPNDYNSYDYLGDLYFLGKNSKEATENWKKAQNLGSKNKALAKKIQTEKYHDPIY